MVIDEVEEEDFRKYKLEIGNSMGGHDHSMRLYEGREGVDSSLRTRARMRRCTRFASTCPVSIYIHICGYIEAADCVVA